MRLYANPDIKSDELLNQTTSTIASCSLIVHLQPSSEYRHREALTCVREILGQYRSRNRRHLMDRASDGKTIHRRGRVRLHHGPSSTKRSEFWAVRRRGSRADASSLADLYALNAHIQHDKGRLDVLFVNAGGASFAPLGEISEEQFDQTFSTNVKGVLFSVQKALPLIPDGGLIVLNASIVSVEGTLRISESTRRAKRQCALLHALGPATSRTVALMS